MCQWLVLIAVPAFQFLLERITQKPRPFKDGQLGYNLGKNRYALFHVATVTFSFII
jgi:hypothetical protein